MMSDETDLQELWFDVLHESIVERWRTPVERIAMRLVLNVALESAVISVTEWARLIDELAAMPERTARHEA